MEYKFDGSLYDRIGSVQEGDHCETDEKHGMKDKKVHWKRRLPVEKRKTKVKHGQNIKGNHYDKRRGMHLYQKKGSRQWCFSDRYA